MSAEPSQPLDRRPTGLRAASARFALREATAEAHARLDALYSRLDLTDPADYATFLTRHARAFLPTEEALDAAGAGALPGWRAARRSDALRSDLAEMGLAPPAPAEPPAFTSQARLFGGLYVLEGSRLGGAVLIRDVAPGLPTRFLTPGNPSLWKAFTAKLDEQLSTPSALHEAAAAASAVFALFERAAG